VIAGVRVDPLRVIPDERGEIRHFFRSDDPAFERFGEVYFSVLHPGWAKGWHLHRTNTLNYAVPVGAVKLVLYDERDGSPTKGEVQEIDLGAAQPVRVRIPPGVWNAHRNEGSTDAVLANCATEPHDPSESIRLALDDPRIPYAWPAGTRGW